MRIATLFGLSLALAACGSLVEEKRLMDPAAEGGTGGSGGEPALSCQAPLVACDGATACVDLATDSGHCGRCGRSCGGEACTDGVCQLRETL